MVELTIFSAPKPFTNSHIATIQWNAIRSWVELGPQVEVVLVGEEAGLAEAAAELGVRHLPQVERNPEGTPLVSSIFALGRSVNDSPLLAYVNADILLLPDFLETAHQTAALVKQFLLVGQRWDLDISQRLDFSEGWQARLQADCRERGRPHPRMGSDYFIFPRGCFNDIPQFAIGRAGWDNWMIYAARSRGWKTIDATESIQIIHQDHDYSHLPNGQPHYRLPETYENIRLAGGRRTIFHLIDTDTRITGGQLLPARLNWEKFWREVEIFPLTRLHSYPLAQIFYAILHPIKAYRDWRMGRR